MKIIYNKTNETIIIIIIMKRIKKGDIFLCIKDVEMDGDPNDIAYRKGSTYFSEADGFITNEEGCKFHSWRIYTEQGLNEFKQHFEKQN